MTAPDPRPAREEVEQIIAEAIDNECLRLDADALDRATTAVLAALEADGWRIVRGEPCLNCQAWADVVQLYGDKVIIDAASAAGCWPEQRADTAVVSRREDPQ